MTPKEQREKLASLRAKLAQINSFSKKEAFVPPGQMPQEVPMDPAMGGAPPMDPGAMDPAMGGAPPVDPGMAPPPDPATMDPAMGGAPPMDPSMMGGGDPLSTLMMQVDAIGLMLMKLVEYLGVPLDDTPPAPAADAAAQMAPGMAPEVAAQEAQTAQDEGLLSDQATQALQGFQGYQ